VVTRSGGNVKPRQHYRRYSRRDSPSPKTEATSLCFRRL